MFSLLWNRLHGSTAVWRIFGPVQKSANPSNYLVFAAIWAPLVGLATAGHDVLSISALTAQTRTFESKLPLFRQWEEYFQRTRAKNLPKEFFRRICATNSRKDFSEEFAKLLRTQALLLARGAIFKSSSEESLPSRGRDPHFEPFKLRGTFS
jgi:hypothetical protein